MRLTNRSGQFDIPIRIETPDLQNSLVPDTGVIPFTSVNIYAKATGFEEINVENVQIFADTQSVQNMKMIPLSEFPDKWNQAETFITPPQNL